MKSNKSTYYIFGIGFFLLAFTLTFLDKNVLDIAFGIGELILSIMIFSIVFVSHKYIVNKGFVFIGFGYLFIFMLSLLSIIGNNVGGLTNILDYDYNQFMLISRLLEIGLFILGLTLYFEKKKLKLKKMLQIGLSIFVISVIVLLGFSIFPSTNNTYEIDLLYKLSLVFLIIGYISVITIMYLKRNKLHSDIIMLTIMFALYILSSALSLLVLQAEIIASIIHMSRFGGLFIFLFFVFKEGLKNPMVVAQLEVEDTREKLVELSRIDELTMIANRRFLFENLDKSFRLAKRETHSIVLLMVDIDDFNGYNDVFGHLHGDSILRRVAQTISRSCKRPLDFVGRYGGEEFLVVLPNSDFDGAMIVSNRILDSIRDLRITHYKYEKKFLTVSIGFGVLAPDKGDEIDDVIKVADEYLYKVKNTGKDAVMGTVIEKGEENNE